MDASNFLMGGGTKAAKFDQVGDEVTGLVVRDPELRQQTDYKTKELKYWKNGDPMMQLVVVIKTDQRDPSDPLDDGERALYVRGKQYTAAVREAVKATGAPGIEVGSRLTVRRTGGQRGVEGDPYTYAVGYARPTNTAANNFLATAGEPDPTATPTPAGQPDMAAILAQLSPDQQRALLARAQTASAPPF